jgi:hypothetical protein
MVLQKREIFMYLTSEEYDEAATLYPDYPDERTEYKDMFEHDESVLEYMIGLGADKDHITEYVKDRLLMYCRWCRRRGFELQPGKRFGFTINMGTGSMQMPPEIEEFVNANYHPHR